MGQETNQETNTTSAVNAIDEEIRQKVIAWLRDTFENGKYRLGNLGTVAPSKDYFLEITNTTNLDLRQLQMKIEIYKDQIKVDQVTARTGADGIKSGKTGQLSFFTGQTGFSSLKVLPETVTYKADWIPDQVMETRPKKKRLFGGKKKPNVSEAFRVGTGDLLKTKRNEYVQKLDDLKNQTTDEEIRKGLEQLIPIVQNIFRRVAEIPGSETGHMMGGGGITEAIACIKAIQTGTLPANLNLEQPIADLDFVRETRRNQQIRAAMTNAFGFGGQNSTVIFKAADQE